MWPEGDLGSCLKPLREPGRAPPSVGRGWKYFPQRPEKLLEPLSPPRTWGGWGEMSPQEIKRVCKETREVAHTLHPVSLQLSLCNYGIKTWNSTLLYCMCTVLCHFITGVDSHNHHCNQDEELCHHHKDIPHTTPLESHPSLSSKPFLTPGNH